MPVSSGKRHRTFHGKHRMAYEEKNLCWDIFKNGKQSRLNDKLLSWARFLCFPQKKKVFYYFDFV